MREEPLFAGIGLLRVHADRRGSGIYLNSPVMENTGTEDPLYAGIGLFWGTCRQRNLRYMLKIARYGDHGDRGSAISPKSVHYGVHADTGSAIAP